MANPVGRPTDYYPELCEKVIPLLKKGASIKEIGWALDVGYSTIYDWMNKYPEFSESIKKGRELSEGWWERQGRINLKKKDFGSTLWFMNMRNRFGWNNNQDLDDNKVTKHEDALKELE